MDCTAARASMSAYLDGELAPRPARAFEAHVKTCESCRTEFRTMQDDAAAIRRHATHYRAPPGLAARVGMALPAPHPRLSRFAPARMRWAAIAASWLVAVALSAAVTWYAAVPGHHQQVAAEVIAAHQRSLLADHLTDVASADPRAVASWFAGRTGTAPPPASFAADGYRLAGGRLDYVNGRPVAAAVYRHQGRVINLFTWKAASGEELAPTTLARGGLNVVYWTRGGIEFWAVSDDSAAALDGLRRLVERADGGGGVFTPHPGPPPQGGRES